MASGTQSLQSPQSPQLPAPPQSSRIPKMTRPASCSGHYLSPALLTAKLSTLLSLSSAKGREVSSRNVSRTPSPRIHLAKPSSARVMPSPTTTPGSGVRSPSTAGVISQNTTPGLRVPPSPFVFKIHTPGLKASKTSDQVSPFTKRGPVQKTSADKVKIVKTKSKPSGDTNAKNPIKPKTVSTKLGLTENRSTTAVTKSLTLSSRKSGSLSTLCPKGSSSTSKLSPANNKENTNPKRPATITRNSLNKSKPLSSALKPVPKGTKTGKASSAPSTKRVLLPNTKTTAATSKPTTVSTASSKEPQMMGQSSSESGSSNGATMIPETQNNEEFNPAETLVPEAPQFISEIETPSRRQSCPSPGPSSRGTEDELKENPTELSISINFENTSTTEMSLMGVYPTLFSPSHPDGNPGASEVWALAGRLFDSSFKTCSSDRPREVGLSPKVEVEVPLSPNALAEYLKDVNEFLETKDVEMKQMTSSDGANKDFQDSSTGYETETQGLLSGSGIEINASTSSNTLEPLDLRTSGGRNPVKSPRKNSPVCVVPPLPATSTLAERAKSNTQCPYCEREIQDTLTGTGKVTRPCGHSLCVQCYARTLAGRPPQCILCYKTTLQTSRKSLA